MIKEEDNFIKLNSYLGDSITITALNDDSSSYMGVKSIAEDQSTIINDSKIIKNKKSKSTKKKKKQKKKEESFHSDSELKSSKSYSPKEKEKENDRNSSEDLLEKENNKEKEKEKCEEQNDVNKEEKNKKNNENLNENKKLEEIETKFEWEGSGKIVYVTGSFCDWKKFYIMTKNAKGIFSLTLSLPRGFHQYKFKVDNNWTYSKIHPKYEDNGYINNYIDTTDSTHSNENEKENEIEIDLEKNNNIISNDKKEEEESKENNKKNKENKKSQEKRKIRKHKKVSSTVLSVNFLNSQNYYTIYYPLRSEFNKKPMSLPGLYKTCFILNEDYKQKEEMKFSEVEYVNNSSSNSSSMSSSEKSLQIVQSKVSLLGEVIPYVKFQNLYHIHSNHLHSKLLYSYVNTIIDSMTTRYRYKYSTYIYYKPNEPVIPLKRTKHSKSFKIKSKK